MTINGSWGYNAGDTGYKSVPALVQMLADIASKGGNLLLNVGPRADGTIQPEFVERLKGMGAWLRVNGEGIYGTQGGPFRPQPWGRCTSKVDSDGHLLYFHFFDVPKDGKVTVTGLTTRVLRTRLVSTAAKVPFEQNGSTLTFELPDKGRDPIDTVVAARLAGAPEVEAPAVHPGDDGTVTLLPDAAEIHGSRLQLENRSGPNLGYWVEGGDYASWTVELPSETTFEVTVLQACPAGSGGSYEVAVGDSRVAGTVRNTSSWEDYAEVTVGKLTMPKGKRSVVVKPTEIQGALMNLRFIRLSPVAP